MSRIIFIRHGETEWNAESRLQGQLDIKLSDLGIKQAKALSKALETYDFNVIYSSPLDRALRTAEIINKKEKDLREAAALSEIFLGPWQGLTVNEVKEKYSNEYEVFKNNPEKYKSNEMESLNELGNRFSDFIKKIMSHDDRLYCVVTHGTILRAGLAKLIFGDVKYMSNLVFENGSITEVDFHKYNGEITPVVYKLNETSHFAELNYDRPSTAILMGVI